MPKRIQMSRQHPWRAENPDAVIVARPSKWGNPIRVLRDTDGHYIQIEDVRLSGSRPTVSNARAEAVDLFASCLEYDWNRYPSVETIRSELAGKDLACWCPLDQKCHADVLLELANTRETQ